MKTNQLTGQIIGAAIEVHKALGPGLLESLYEECLCHELDVRHIPYGRQQALPVEYKGFKIDPHVAKVEDAADSRRQGCSRRKLLQILDNTEDAVSSAFPKGKQHDVFWVSLDFTAGDIQD